MNPIVRLLRPKDWVKNAFIIAPLFFSPDILQLRLLLVVFGGVVVFCFLASSVYIFNDLRDCISDRLHPVKQFRPLAANQISVTTARFLCVIFLIAGLAGAFYLSFSFFEIALIYLLINLAYSMGLKQVAIIDVYCVTAGFVLRVVAGAVLISVTPSVWILMCTGLLALFLALGKRRDDLVKALDASHRKSIQGYNLPFIDTSIAMILSALLIAYTMYTTSSGGAHLHAPHFYWTVPLVLLGVLRYLQITLVFEKSGSPTNLVFSDRFLLITILSWIIFSAALIY